MPTVDDLRTVLLRDLRALGREVQRYPDDPAVWRAVPGLTNAGGTLVLHLAGNLRHFIGAVLGQTGFIRDRDSEFSLRGQSRAELGQLVEQTIADVDRTLAALTDAQLAADYPLPLAGKQLTTSRFLMHLAVHLTYHLGQIDYHRRAVAPESGVAETMALTEL